MEVNYSTIGHPSLLSPIPEFPCWSGYRQHTEEKPCVWFCFSQCLLHYPHPCYSISVCTFPVPIPLHCAFSPSGFFKVYGISCCLMPSAAVYFLKRKHLLSEVLGFLSGLQSVPARLLQTGSLTQHLYSPGVFLGLLANSMVFVPENHKL